MWDFSAARDLQSRAPIPEFAFRHAAIKFNTSACLAVVGLLSPISSLKKNVLPQPNPPPFWLESPISLFAQSFEGTGYDDF